jgi:hypothetical protein
MYGLVAKDIKDGNIHLKKLMFIHGIEEKFWNQCLNNGGNFF